ncbi:N-6 DNA methylase [Streptomyces sp. NPDC005931]|uniref:N-6 DNA methylase n=1 Tax=Streptomyces sp. NPDC005931 TaxID=3364737 RepID=UPI0036BD3F01
MQDSATEVTAAGIARLAGVGRAAVSNWRRRHPDFPKPVGGTETSPSFALAEVEAWLRRHGKLAEVPLRERVWQQLVGHPEGPVTALTHAGCVLLLIHDRSTVWLEVSAGSDERLAAMLPGALERVLTPRFGAGGAGVGVGVDAGGGGISGEVGGGRWVRGDGGAQWSSDVSASLRVNGERSVHPAVGVNPVPGDRRDAVNSAVAVNRPAGARPSTDVRPGGTAPTAVNSADTVNPGAANHLPETSLHAAGVNRPDADDSPSAAYRLHVQRHATGVNRADAVNSPSPTAAPLRPPSAPQLLASAPQLLPSAPQLLPSVPLLRGVAELAAELGARQTFEFLLGRHLDANPRQYTLTPAGLADLMADLTGPAARAVLDPACGTGALLRALAARPGQELYAQDAVPELAALTALRLALHSRAPVRVSAGDTLRADAHPGLRADAVLCHPPFNERNWGHDQLAYDARWEYGFPARTESELAWVQHALARLKDGGTAVLLMPPAAASRRSGRRIRADLLRRGALRAVIALPVGAAPPYNIPLHLWVLRRPPQAPVPPEVLLVDAGRFAAEGRGGPDWPGCGTRSWTPGGPTTAPAVSTNGRASPVPFPSSNFSTTTSIWPRPATCRPGPQRTPPADSPTCANASARPCAWPRS